MSSLETRIFPSLQGDEVPAGSRTLLEKVQTGFGVIPNLYAAFSNSPVLLDGYMSAADRQLVLLAASAVNECAYCIAAHSTTGKNMLKLPAAVVAAVSAGQPVEDAKLDALVNLTREPVLSRGHVAVETSGSFLNAGNRGDQIGDHLSPVEIDDAFKAEA